MVCTISYCFCIVLDVNLVDLVLGVGSDGLSSRVGYYVGVVVSVTVLKIVGFLKC